MTVTVVHSCTHTREIEVPGIRRAREMKRWMATVKCPVCREAGK